MLNLPLSLPALCTLIYGVVYYHISVWLVVTWPFFEPPPRYASEYSFLASQLNYVHAGWIILLLLNLLTMRSKGRELPKRRLLAEWFAVVIASCLLASSVFMSQAVPAITDPPYEKVVFEFEYDPADGEWIWVPPK